MAQTGLGWNAIEKDREIELLRAQLKERDRTIHNMSAERAYLKERVECLETSLALISKGGEGDFGHTNEMWSS